MKKIKIFTHNDTDRLEVSLNNWLQENKHISLYDIKYSSSMCCDKDNTYCDYSALVYYGEL